jgi:hypothetical protein
MKHEPRPGVQVHQFSGVTPVTGSAFGHSCRFTASSASEDAVEVIPLLLLVRHVDDDNDDDVHGVSLRL